MYSKGQLLLKYLHYYFSASNGKGHGMHSPFVFEFITKILNDKTVYPEYEKVETLREQLLNDDTILDVEDLGAGSSVSKTNKRRVSSITRAASKPKKYAQLLYRIAKYYGSQYVIELGTSLGITASYLSLALGDKGYISTVEGAKSIAQITKLNFTQLKLKNITLYNEPFEDCMSSLIEAYPRIDLLFIDGNHRKEPTLKYFDDFLYCIENESIMIFDDLHWSAEMEEAWKIIKNHEAVTCSIDLFFIGIVFFRKEFKEKQHFVIRF